MTEWTPEKTADLRRTIKTYRLTAEECEHHEDDSLAPDLHDAATNLERALDHIAEQAAEIERLRKVIDLHTFPVSIDAMLEECPDAECELCSVIVCFDDTVKG